MKLLIIFGPNLNFTGIRERDVYGSLSYKEMIKQIKDYAKKMGKKAVIKQTNSEGEFIDYIQYGYRKKYDGLIINPGAYSHYSYAIMDAIKSVNIRTIEVHLSDIFMREDFRKQTITGNACEEIIAGKGIEGYFKAIDKF